MLRLDHLTIMVGSIEGSRSFYETLLPLLGFSRTTRENWTDGKGFFFQFLEAREGSRPYDLKLKPPHVQYAHPTKQIVFPLRETPCKVMCLPISSHGRAMGLICRVIRGVGCSGRMGTVHLSHCWPSGAATKCWRPRLSLIRRNEPPLNKPFATIASSAHGICMRSIAEAIIAMSSSRLSITLVNKFEINSKPGQQDV